jgi:GNAT superfamily N-acetyltransferase
MAADLHALPEDETTPVGVTIVPVADERALRDWIEVSGPSHDEPADMLQTHFAVPLDLGLGADLPLHRYVAYLDGQPVAKSALFLADGVAGVYDVATVPHARRRGLGAAMTLAPLRYARELGYRIAVLQSSPMAVDLYPRLGFQQVCTLSVYLFEPSV